MYVFSETLMIRKIQESVLGDLNDVEDVCMCSRRL